MVSPTRARGRRVPRTSGNGIGERYTREPVLRQIEAASSALLSVWEWRRPVRRWSHQTRTARRGQQRPKGAASFPHYEKFSCESNCERDSDVELARETTEESHGEKVVVARAWRSTISSAARPAAMRTRKPI